MKCPRCGSELRERIYEASIRVDECGHCGGLWLDRGELVQLEETVTGDDPSYRGVNDAVAKAYEQARQMSRPDITCPKCGRAMTKREAHSTTQVVIDVCPPCAGAWLDGGEAQALERFCEGLRADERREAERGFFSGLARLFG